MTQTSYSRLSVEGANPAPTPPLRRILSEVSDLGAQPGSRGQRRSEKLGNSTQQRMLNPMDVLKCPYNNSNIMSGPHFGRFRDGYRQKRAFVFSLGGILPLGFFKSSSRVRLGNTKIPAIRVVLWLTNSMYSA